MRNVQKPYLFEVAWEVANKVGGIYTVIKTKVPVTVEEYHERYFLIGPVAHNSHLEVEEQIPRNNDVKESLDTMRHAGIKILYGKWLITGSPSVILFDLGSAWSRLGEWLDDFQRHHSVTVPAGDKETNDAIVFGYLVSWFFGELTMRNKRNAVIAHFHEWQAGAALPLIKRRSIEVATVFTTHATLLGRYLCAGSVDFYNSLDRFDVDMEAGKRGIYHRYCLERAATHCADVFTTVSHITAYEAENLLKRKPDGVLPNGLDVVKFSAMHEFQNLHALHKAKITEFVRGHFYGHLDFDLDNTIYFFTAGRYEYRNKGVDMFLEALARVNYQLKQLNSPITVVAFIIMPAPNLSFTAETLKGQAVVKQLRETVSLIQENIGKRIFEECARGGLPSTKELISEEEMVLLKRRIYSLKRDTLPPVVTHNMTDDVNDPILTDIRRLGLVNNKSDRVKIVFHPEFINSNNPLFGLEYEDFVRGCHLGVFPSYYEPWGYTPAEATVMGIPSISTNLSGFGCFMEENIENPSDYGIYIVDRRMKSIEESIQQMSEQMISFCQKTRRQRINQRNRVERLSDILDWKLMGLEYVKARHLAIHRKYPGSLDSDDEVSLSDDGTEIQSSSQTPTENENAGTVSPLEEGRKIRKPFSATTSPRFWELKSDSLDHSVVSEKLQDLKVKQERKLSRAN